MLTFLSNIFFSNLDFCYLKNCQERTGKNKEGFGRRKAEAKYSGGNIHNLKGEKN